MSRSFKKNPVVKDHDTGKWGKKQANRAVRRYKGEIHNGKAYRKHYCSWDIHDYISYFPKEEAIDFYKKFWADVKFPYRNGTFEDYMNHWEKDYHRK